MTCYPGLVRPLRFSQSLWRRNCVWSQDWFAKGEAPVLMQREADASMAVGMEKMNTFVLGVESPGQVAALLMLLLLH